MIKQGHMLRDILLSAIIFILFLILLFFLISGYTNLVQKHEQRNKSDQAYKMATGDKKSPYIPKIEVFRAPEKVSHLLKDWNITNVHVMTEEGFEKEMQRYSAIREKAHSYINLLR